jgi:hypothetical protein
MSQACTWIFHGICWSPFYIQWMYVRGDSSTQNAENQSKNTTQKTKKMSNMDPTKQLRVNPGGREESAVPY